MSEEAAVVTITAHREEVASTRFEELYTLNYPSIYRYVYRLTGRADQAGDLTQETFLRLYHHLQAARPLNNPRAWLYTVATRLSYNELKRKRTFKVVIQNWMILTERAASLETEYWQQEKRELVKNALNRLPVRDQVLIQLFQDDLSYDEIAAAAGVRPVSVGRLLSRAIKRCARFIER